MGIFSITRYAAVKARVFIARKKKVRDGVKFVLTFVLDFGWLFDPFASGCAQKTAGLVLTELGRLSPDKRQKALTERAKAEGEVT